MPVIEADIKGFSYYIRKQDHGFRYEGLINNASVFTNEEVLNYKILIQRSTPWQLTIINPNKN